jgi:hypothetical protein
MLESFTIATVTPHVGDAFLLRASPEIALPLTLTSATGAGPVPDDAARRVPFALLFHGPQTPILPQRIYRLEHDALGTFDLFLVPLGPDARGMRYEAVFA